MAFPLVISFYTVGTLYQLEVQNLVESCRKFGIETCIEGVPSFGSWELNCAYKPFFILEKLKQLGRPVLWVDADGVFVREPASIEEFTADCATRINLECPEDHPSRVISSTVFLNNTSKAEELLRRWAVLCKEQLLNPERKEEFWDQIALRDAIAEQGPGARIVPLPLAYAKIFDHQRDKSLCSDPVIEHYQASRRFKKMVNEGD